MKHLFRNLFLHSALSLLTALLLISPMAVHAENDYLEHENHYTVQTMGDGVLRFTIPIWVYGAVNDYYLECSQNRDDNNDSYVWYSQENGVNRGTASVHRIASITARRYGKNDTSSSEGEGFIYCHEGAIVIQSIYSGEKIALQAGDATYWTKWENSLSLKRKEDDDHKRITYITFDWYSPASLQKQKFYCGVSASVWNKYYGKKYKDFWWQLPGTFEGGMSPQSPQLTQPYLYALNENGATAPGYAAIQYAAFQRVEKYKTGFYKKFNNNWILTSQGSDMIIVPTADSVQHRFSALFHVCTREEAPQLYQDLYANEVDIPAYHRVYNLTATPILDEKQSVTGKMHLNWHIESPGAKDLVESDVFELQRATKADFSDAQTIDVQPFNYKSSNYSYEDDPLTALGADTATNFITNFTTQSLQEQGSYTALDSAGNPMVDYLPTMVSHDVKLPGCPLYYRVRRGSASVWDWKSPFADSAIVAQQAFLAPLAKEQDNYKLDPDFKNNRKVHFSIKLENRTLLTEPEPIDQCEYTTPISRYYGVFPVCLKVVLRKEDNPNNYNYSIEYRLPESSQVEKKDLSFFSDNIIGTTLPVGSSNVILKVIEKNTGHVMGEFRINTSEPCFAVLADGSYFLWTQDWGVWYYGIAGKAEAREAFYQELRTKYPVPDTVKTALYQKLKDQAAKLSKDSSLHCNWDQKAVIYLQRHTTTDSITETKEIPVPADSITRTEDGSWVAHFTDVADRPCTDYAYSVRIDQSHSLLRLAHQSDTLPVTIKGNNLYFNSAARISELQATDGTDRYGVLLNWTPTGGGVEYYTIERREHGSTGEFTPLVNSQTETNYRDRTAKPGKEYDYRVSAHYTCNDTTTFHNDTVTGRRSPYGQISGRIHYEDGVGCAGITVAATSKTNSQRWECLTDEAGNYTFDSLLYYQNGSEDVYTEFAISPTSQTAEFRYNNTSAQSASITLDPDQPVKENIEFDNISAVRMSGRVLYKNSTIPVRDANLLLNGRIVKNAAGVVKTDAAGDFVINVPKNSEFTIQVIKAGHSFEGDGFVRIDGSEKLTLTSSLDGVIVFDRTKVRLAGRIVGGRNQASKPLGFGLSQNNLGDNIQMVLELEGDNISQIVHFEEEDKDTLHFDVPHPVLDTAGKTHQTGMSHMLYQRKRITITADPKTGEFCADLFPVRYKVVQATATGYATLFAQGKTSETIDLSDAAYHHDSAVYEGLTARWNQRYDITYRSPITISCIQMRYGMPQDFYGEETMARQNIKNEDVKIPLAERDSNGVYQYLFGHPVFNTGTYRFRVTAHEDYYYNNITSNRHEEVRIKGGMLKVYNGMHDTIKTSLTTVPLDEEGQTEITVPVDYVSFIKTGENALRVLDLSLETDGQFVEYQPFKGYVMGNRAKGRDFLTGVNAKVHLLDVLRDPPGAKSYAYIEKGTTYKYNYTTDFSIKFGLEIGFTYGSSKTLHMGTYLGAGSGLYSGYPVSYTTGTSMAFPITSSMKYKHGGSYSFTTSERIETGSDEFHVGAEGDVYIGTTQSVYFGLTDAVKPIDSLTYSTLAAHLVDSVGKIGTSRMIASGHGSDGKKYYLVIGEETETGTYISGTFAYTQDHIINSLLPRLMRERNALLISGDSATVQGIANARNEVVYWSKVTDESQEYGLKSYKKIYPTGVDLPSEWINIDRVAEYNAMMTQWIDLIKQNEKEKLSVMYGINADTVGNYSISNGLKESHSETYEYSSTIAYRWDFPGSSLKTNAGLYKSSGEGIHFTSNTPADLATQKFQNQLHALYQNNSALQNLINEPNADGNGDKKDENETKSPYDIDIEMPDSKLKWQINPILDVGGDRDPSVSVSNKKTAGFTLATDGLSYMNVTVARLREEKNQFNQESKGERDFISGGNDYNGKDYQYGSYVYFLNGGATKCPWEGPEEAVFYEQGGQTLYTSQGTLKLENPRIDIDVHERSDVPHDKPAIFNLTLSNEIEQTLGMPAIIFKLKLDEPSNPHGAKIMIDGSPLTGDGRAIKIGTGEIVQKKVEVYAGEGYDYENITLMLASTCDVFAYSKATLSVHYMPVSCDVNIAAPHDRWTLNTLSPRDSTGYYIPVVIDGFNVNYDGFDHIELQYKLTKHSDDGWVNMCSFYANDSLYRTASGTKAMINGGRIENIRFYGERDPIEQLYDLRAVSFCRHGNSFITRNSAVISGIKDTRVPCVFGEPEPVNAILGVGEHLKLRFNEPIAGNYLDATNNFQITGITNETGITTNASVHFDGSPESYALSYVKRSLSDRSFSLDMMVKPSSTTTAETFFQHGLEGEGVIFGRTTDNRLSLKIGNSLTLFSKPLDLPMTAFTRVIVVYDRDANTVRFYAGTKDVTDPAASALPQDFSYTLSAPLVFGRGLDGNMLELRLWAKALDSDEIAATDRHYLTGFEQELTAYYRMNEGAGTELKDYASGATMTMHSATWTLPKGLSLVLSNNDSIRLADEYLSRSNAYDATYMFWFRNTNTDGTVFRAGGKRFELNQSDLYWTLDDSTSFNLGRVELNQWHHVVLNISRTYNNVSIYLDNKLVSSYSASRMTGVSGQMYFGGNGFTGNIDEFVLFEQSLPKKLIDEYSHRTPSGDEMGLIAWLPFEEQKRNANNILELVFSVNDRHTFRNSKGEVVKKTLSLVKNDTATISQLADRTNYAPVTGFGYLSNMYFDWAYNEDELLINLKMNDYEINKQQVYVTVRDVEDLNGNPMPNPVTWVAFVDRNVLKWEDKSIFSIHHYEDGDDDEYWFTTTNIINTSGKRHDFRIESLPDWLTASQTIGTLQPTEYYNIRFDFDPSLPVGEYSDIIYLTDENGLSEPLKVEYSVKADCPWEEPQPSDYTMNMNICAQVLVNGVYDTNSDDKVIALFNGKCVGMANVTFDSNSNRSDVYLTVYGTDDMVRKPLNFVLWQASTGKTLILSPNRNILFAHGFVYGCGNGQKVEMQTVGSESQNIPLYQGWTWVSFNIFNQDNISNLSRQLSVSKPWKEGDLIKNPATRQFGIYSEDNACFTGSLTKLNYTQIYMIYSHAANTLRYSGINLSPDSMHISVRGDGQWSPFPCLFGQATPLTEAMADYYDYAAEGDLIKGQTKFAYFSSDKKWVGSLTALRPGEGYLFRRMGQGAKTIHFHDKAANAPKHHSPSLSQREGAGNAFSNPQASSNMTMICQVEGKTDNIQRDNVQCTKVMAYIGDELVGVAEPLSLEERAGERVLYFLTVQSDAVGSPLRFETEDGMALQAINHQSPITDHQPVIYTPNDHIGSLKAPVLLTPGENDRVYKMMENNHIIIIRNNEKYDVTGKKL